ncbi:MAG TPA: MFS transporter [Terriglobales bacterium]|nr:MFS transporter [Terriglobales bacterium]
MTKAKHKPADASPPHRLSASVIALYGMPSLGTGALLGMLLLYYMKFATDVLLIAPATAGLIIGMSRLWDAIADPIAGYWSDRTRTRWGRRRPWIVFSAFPLGLAFFAVWAPPAALGDVAMVVWTSVSTFVFLTAYTTFTVPYRAFGAELSDDYHERTRVFAVSSFAGFAGAFFAIAMTYALERSAEQRGTAAAYALAAGCFTTLAMILMAARLKERAEFQGRGGEQGWRSFLDVWRNPHARPLLAIHVLGDLGSASFAGLMPFVSDYILKTPGSTHLYQLALLVGLTAGIPLWVPIARRLGKRGAWALATAIQVPLCGIYFLLGEGDSTVFLIGMGLIGVLNACAPTVAQSVQADVIDYDEYLTGERKEGVYFASWNLVQKMAYGLNFALVGLLLEWSGFVANVEQNDATRLAIGIGFAGLPLLTVTASLICLLRFDFDEQAHAKVRSELLIRATAGTLQRSPTPC